jgi:hypothetical protein
MITSFREFSFDTESELDRFNPATAPDDFMDTVDSIARQREIDAKKKTTQLPPDFPRPQKKPKFIQAPISSPQ